MLKGISGPATRVVSDGRALMPITTGAETLAATRCEVAVWWLRWQVWQFALDSPR